MIGHSLGLRINPAPDRDVRAQVREAARIGAQGVVLDAAGDLSPDRLSETGRREVRHLVRTVELTLIALNLPIRRPFDSEEQLDDRLARADRAFALAYELGARLVLARVGPIPVESDAARLAVFIGALRELGRRADHRGIRLAIETQGAGEPLAALLDRLASPGLAASLDPAAILRLGIDPPAAARALGAWVAHAYANDTTAASDSLHGHGTAGEMDWAEYLGALEEIPYRGFLTVWHGPTADAAARFAATVARLNRLG